VGAGAEEDVVIGIWKEGVFLVVVVRGEEEVLSVSEEIERWVEIACFGDHGNDLSGSEKVRLSSTVRKGMRMG
jgi:hypothetical protein